MPNRFIVSVGVAFELCSLVGDAVPVIDPWVSDRVARFTTRAEAFQRVVVGNCDQQTEN